MNRVEELIERLCPEGVKTYSIDELCTISRGRVISKTYVNENKGIFPVYSSQTENSGELGCISSYDYDGEYLTWTTDGANAGTVFYRYGKFSITNVCGLLRVKNALVSTKYLYYTLSVEAQKYVNRGMGNPKLMSNTMARISVFVPPLEVQNEIVNILDNFSKLEAELKVELEVRKQQYDYYRDTLLTFDDSVPWKSLEEEFSFIRNGFVGTVTPYFTSKETGVRYLQGTNIHNGIITDNEEFYITTDFHKKHIKNELKADDIIMVQSGHVGESAVVGEKYKGSNCHALIIMSNGRKNCNSKFVNYYFQSTDGKKKLNAISTGGTLKHILSSKMKKFKIPVPPLEEQARIVSILDHFDKLCNDLTEGLPAEIEARRKQYEYYRDLLLTFKMKVPEKVPGE